METESMLEYITCADGWCVIESSMPPEDPHAGLGITVPAEIKGIPVTQLHISWYGDLDFISGPNLRKATIHIYPPLLHPKRPTGRIVIHGPLQELTLVASRGLKLSLCSDNLRGLRVDSPDLCVLDSGLRHCPALESACFFGTVTELGSHAFEGCRHLETVVLPADLTCIPDYCFSNCTALSHDFLPRATERIGRGAFAACERLKLSCLPPKLTSVGTRAFYGVPLPSPLYVSPQVAVLENQALGAEPGLILQGLPGTAAERYAAAHGLIFQT